MHKKSKYVQLCNKFAVQRNMMIKAEINIKTHFYQSDKNIMDGI